jgi:hypothetical protein
MAKIDPTEPEELDDGAVERQFSLVAEAAEIDPQNLTVLAERELQLELLGEAVRDFKVLDRKSGRTITVSLGEGDRVVDGAAMLAREREASFERYGTLQRALHEVAERQAQSQPESLIPVVLKYVIKDEEEGVDKREFEDVDDKLIDELSARAERYEANRREQAIELHRGAMADVNVEVDGEEPVSGPFVRASLSPEAILKLGRDERVAFIGLDGEPDVLDYPTIAESLPTTRTDTVHSTGVTGNGIRIAVLESGSLWKNQACFNIAEIQDATVAVSSHMTKSVAIIGNRYSGGACDGDWQGYAPDADVYLANTSDYQDRYDWARARSINVITMSWHKTSEETDGGLHSRDVYFDYWALRWPYPSIFASAGNQAEEDAYASGKGYNFLGVGNVENDGDGDRCNDAIYFESSWKNPISPHSDREIPEIASPGSRHDLLGSSFGGTSCATPVTASIAALLMSRNTSLKIWPEAIRAILQATANYQDADGSNWSKWSDGKDGTGMTNSLYGMWTAGRRESGTTAQYRAHDYGRMRDDDFSGGFFEKTWKVKTYSSKSRIRVALAWNSKVSSSGGDPTSSVLDADLDLWLYDPDGNLVRTSSTWDSSYEFIEFTPTKMGEYEIKVRGYSVPNNFASWYGMAWTTHYDLC